MYKPFSIVAIVALNLCAATGQADPKSDQVYIQVRSSKLRAQPLMWSSAVGDLNYGDQLTLVKEDAANGWLKVKSGKGVEGYLHKSAISTRRVVLAAKAGMKDGRADISEVVLAGKGFNREVEAEYARAQGFNYSLVDKVEKARTNSAEIAQFIKSGQLKATQG